MTTSKALIEFIQCIILEVQLCIKTSWWGASFLSPPPREVLTAYKVCLHFRKITVLSTWMKSKGTPCCGDLRLTFSKIKWEVNELRTLKSGFSISFWLLFLLCCSVCNWEKLISAFVKSSNMLGKMLGEKEEKENIITKSAFALW